MKDAKRELKKVRKCYDVIDEHMRKLLRLMKEQGRTCDLIAGEFERQRKLLDALGDQVAKAS